ncbi:MAG: type II toxin-antitoxin system VapC family toxin [Gammaproteobacteria bacterium]|nr:type II toxin-antitoxin system VapC family toxin [Gammaproteobacteria bacterium]MCW8839848.1 type II toxin-antitoxin system VapC family toxin [Gammaproteobacteria bacterium]MCW8928320.1 type II toxin-antitoxin system VapC family toxin [Gammaproteobacteria bacterium]MCW8958447.1 type II toxin-antitoxin system VapC family toxin [Gammaproteobacteria bacterium]MCW8972472.1 type II toxin-antitoxin system VapC family toxin [Gammaproteobacteria bacterium]
MIVLDTHTLIWWVNGDGQLSQKARKAIENELTADGQVMVSAISAWEIAMLVSKGRLALTMDIDDWLETVASIEGVSFVSVDADVAVQSVRLPGEFHPDPADRLIVALARHHSAPLVTADTKIREYRHVKTVW